MPDRAAKENESPVRAATPPAPGGEFARKFNIDFQFRLTVQHPELDMVQMFRAAEAFDHYEVNGANGENKGKPRKDVCVDVLECTPTATTLHITPGRPMTYVEIATEMDLMVSEVAKHHLPGGKARGVKVQWIVPNPGIASDMRGRLSIVH